MAAAAATTTAPMAMPPISGPAMLGAAAAAAVLGSGDGETVKGIKGSPQNGVASGDGQFAPASA